MESEWDGMSRTELHAPGILPAERPFTLRMQQLRGVFDSGVVDSWEGTSVGC
ncbi:hypothetical protein [uncultured Chryseobacterium sp.]|uniref:hypothetical protein n=1 Tax=uncultured Chryseobacterium sp. TaxID=259322 RepID=UPI0025E34E09|nr:hypothetical protein [uncultured Chryseobacterium sp.]